MHSTNKSVVFLDVETTPFVLRMVDAAADAFKRYLAYRRRLTDRAALTTFGDRELKDIGLYRSDLDRIMNGGGR